MKKYIIVALLTFSILNLTSLDAKASYIAENRNKTNIRKELKQDTTKIKELFKIHGQYSNNHDLAKLKTLYANNYINSDGFNKEAYFKSIDDTWRSSKDLTYDTNIISIKIDGDNASVDVEETATGTITDTIDGIEVLGELHSKAKGAYHLIKINDTWYISGETAISDESSLLYGETRFMDIQMQAPAQVGAGETYTATLKVNSDNNMYILASIARDPVTYPTNTPENQLRVLGQSQTLERLMRANSDNINEYAVASLAVSKIENPDVLNTKVYMVGLACIMKRVNVIPKNNYINIED